MSARDSILTLICGYPASVRRERRLAMLVCYIDESGKGGQVFLAAGLTARADPNWLRFSDEWELVLKEKPAIPFFHLADRQGLSEKDHWSKIYKLIDIISNHVDHVSLMITHTEDYKTVFGGMVGATYDNPCQQSYMSVIQQCALEAPEGCKIDFVFDDMDDTQYLELLAVYRDFKATCPNQMIRNKLGGDPIRQNDKFVVPLQGADLIVGLARRAYEGQDGQSFAALSKLRPPIAGIVWGRRKN